MIGIKERSRNWGKRVRFGGWLVAGLLSMGAQANGQEWNPFLDFGFNASARDSSRRHNVTTWSEAPGIGWNGVSYRLYPAGKGGQLSTLEASWEGVSGWSRAEFRGSFGTQLSDDMEGSAWLGAHSVRFSEFHERVSGLSAGLGWAGSRGLVWCAWTVPKPEVRLGAYTTLYRGELHLCGGFERDGWGVRTLFVDVCTRNGTAHDVALRWFLLPMSGSLTWSGQLQHVKWRVALGYGVPWGTRVTSNWKW